MLVAWALRFSPLKIDSVSTATFGPSTSAYSVKKRQFIIRSPRNKSYCIRRMKTKVTHSPKTNGFVIRGRQRQMMDIISHSRVLFEREAAAPALVK